MLYSYCHSHLSERGCSLGKFKSSEVLSKRKSNFYETSLCLCLALCSYFMEEVECANFNVLQLNVSSDLSVLYKDFDRGNFAG